MPVQCVSVCMLCATTQSCVLSTLSIYREHVLLRLETSSLSAPHMSVIILVLKGYFLCLLMPVCLFICLGNYANMTLCALDTRNDSKRNSNAVIIVLLQFNSFFHHILLFCSFYMLSKSFFQD